jgi:TRAP-type uncharacterized transport system fused permease subunit
MKTGVTAVKLALAGFIVPFIYVFNPILVLVDYSFVPFALAVGTAMLGVMLLGMSTVGYFRGALSMWKRALALGGALFLLIPGWQSDLFGIAVLVLLYFLQTFSSRKAALG